MKPTNSSYSVTQFIPLFIIFSLIFGATLLTQWYTSFSLMHSMRYFMAYFFLLFGTFKVMRWHAFVTAYQMYDILAQKSTLYAYSYPLIEIALGFAYLLYGNVPVINIITLLLMSISAVGVFQELRAGKKITCACLGTVFKIPMTWVTFLEDILMALMALIMLFL
jgi:hypothetical protein